MGIFAYKQIRTILARQCAMKILLIIFSVAIAMPAAAQGYWAKPRVRSVAALIADQEYSAYVCAREGEQSVSGKIASRDRDAYARLLNRRGYCAVPADAPPAQRHWEKTKSGCGPTI